MILFGTFAVFAVFGSHLIDRRKRGAMGAEWHRLRLAVADAPLVSVSGSRDTLMSVSAGIALYATFLWAHPILFGVSPLP